MLRKHAVTLEFDEKQNVYILNIDGYSITLTQNNMKQINPSVAKGGKEGAEEIASFLKEQDPELYESKLTPPADNPNSWDVLEVLQCQFSKPVFTQRPES